MEIIPIVEPFAKASVSRDAVELERQDRMKMLGAVSCVITEDADHWILTTNIRLADDAGSAVRYDRLENTTTAVALDCPTLLCQSS